MSAKIVIGGVEITVPTNELGEAMQQLGRWLPQVAASAPQVPTASAKPSASIAAPTTPASHDSVLANVTRRLEAGEARATVSDRATAKRLLQLIDDHHVSGGVTAEHIMPVLGTDKAKGIGSKTTAVNRAIVAAGFPDLTDVYTNTERTDPKGPRQWRAGPRIKEAIQALSAQT